VIQNKSNILWRMSRWNLKPRCSSILDFLHKREDVDPGVSDVSVPFYLELPTEMRALLDAGKEREIKNPRREDVVFQDKINTKERTPMKNRLTLVILTACIFLMSIVSVSAAIDTIECNRNIAQTTVHSTAIGLGEVLKNITDEKERIHLIGSFIDPIRFFPDKSGYFYVYNYDCVNTAHATQKDLVGKNLYNYKDCKGKFVIRELAEAARKGGGFVEYYWAQPDLTGTHKKMGYVEPIPNTKYFIGTGVYLDEITLGETLVRQLWADLKDRDIEAVRKKFADGFQSVHQYGTNNREQEIELLKGLNLGEYTLSNFQTTRNGPVITAAYFISAEETINGKRLSNNPTPRMSVFLKTQDGWQWIAHANLKPMEQIKQ